MIEKSETLGSGFRLQICAVWMCRAILAGVFLFAAWPKIQDPAGFAKAISNYQLLPYAVINLLAIFLPWLEIFAAAALLIAPALRRGALLMIAGMTLVFTGAIGLAMARGIDIDCGCFSTTGSGMKAGWLHLLLDAGLLAVCIALMRLGCHGEAGAKRTG